MSPWGPLQMSPRWGSGAKGCVPIRHWYQGNAEGGAEMWKVFGDLENGCTAMCGGREAEGKLPFIHYLFFPQGL